MKSYNKYLLSALIASTAVSAGFAQTPYSGYFLDNFTNRYLLNPAMADTTRNGFVSMPIFGNFNIRMNGNAHLTDFLYNVDGRTVLFTNPDVPASTVLKRIGNKNRLGLSTDLNILAVGFSAFGGKNAVTIGAVADAEVMVPGSLIKMAKEGVANKTYDITNLRMNANAYAKIQLNHSRDIKQVPGLRVGAALKFLLGLGNLDAYMNQAHLQLGQDAWTIRTNADVYANIKGASFKQKYSDTSNKYYVDGLELDGFGLNGFGMGFDLGGTYEWKDFQFSLSLLDLGFMSWSHTIKASSNGTHEVSTADYTFSVDDDKDLPEGQQSEWDRFKDNLSQLYQLEEDGNIGGRTTGLRATLNWGVRYTLPYYRRLNFGMVNNTRFNGSFTTTDFRFSANVNPVDCLSASVNFAAGTYGVGFGWLLNLNVKGFSFYVGMDRTMGKLAKQGIPLNSNAEVNFGMNFPF